MIELADVISELRAELDRARSAADGSALRFELGPVELELSVAVGREGKGGARVKFWVAEAGAEGMASSTSTQRIKLTLTPTVHGASDDSAVAAPASVYVGGDAVPGER